MLVVEGVGLAGSLLGVRQFAGWPLGRGALKGLAAAAAAAVVASSLPDGLGRLLAALLAYAVALVALRPLPASVCVRLVRGALGRPGPPTAAGAS